MRFHTASLLASTLLVFACGDDSVTGGGPSSGGAPTTGGQNPGGEGGGNPVISGGNNNGGAAPGPQKIGMECLSDADCDPDGFCIAQKTNGFPKGYCSAQCDVDSDCGVGVCYEEAQACLFPCGDTADCRAGYSCQTISAGTSSDSCFPDCTANSDCAKPAECIVDEADPNLGFCIEDEVCDDDTDNDLDGRPDCTDSDCNTISPCLEQIGTACSEAGAFTTPSNGDTTTGDNLFAPVNCGGTTNTGFGNELLFTYTAAATGQLHVEAAPNDADIVLYARAVCAGDETGDTMLDCSDDPQDGAATEIIDIGLVQDQTVTIFVDSWQVGQEGPYALTSTFTPAVCGDGMTTLPETCDDTNAVSGDGCSDTCQVELDFYCNNAIPLALNTPTVGNTATGTNLFQAPQDAIECTFGGAGLAPGQEVLYVYTPAASGMLQIDLTSTSDSDFGLYARTDCLDVATQLGCSDVNFQAGMNDESLTIPVTNGVPVTIFVDAYQVAGGAFSIELTQN